MRCAASGFPPVSPVSPVSAVSACTGAKDERSVDGLLESVSSGAVGALRGSYVIELMRNKKQKLVRRIPCPQRRITCAWPGKNQ